jgi:hypothetical protein
MHPSIATSALVNACFRRFSISAIVGAMCASAPVIAQNNQETTPKQNLLRDVYGPYEWLAENAGAKSRIFMIPNSRSAALKVEFVDALGLPIPNTTFEDPAGTYTSLLKLSLLPKELNNYIKAIVVAKITNNPALNQLPGDYASYLGNFELDGGLVQDLVVSEPLFNLQREVDLKDLEFTQVPWRAVSVSVKILGKEVASYSQDEMLPLDAVIPLFAENLSTLQANLLRRGQAEVSVKLTMDVSRLQSANLTMDYKKVLEAFTSNLESERSNLNENNKSLVLWKSMSRALDSNASLARNSAMQTTQSWGGSFLMRDLEDEGLRAKAFDAIFSPPELENLTMEKLIARHESAINAAKGPLQDAHREYVKYLRGLDKNQDADSLNKALDKLLEASKSSGEGAAASSNPNPYVAAGAFLAKGIAFKRSNEDSNMEFRATNDDTAVTRVQQRLSLAISRQIQVDYVIPSVSFP